MCSRYAGGIACITAQAPARDVAVRIVDELLIVGRRTRSRARRRDRIARLHQAIDPVIFIGGPVALAVSHGRDLAVVGIGGGNVVGLGGRSVKRSEPGSDGSAPS